MLLRNLRSPRSAAAVAVLLFLSACASAPPGPAPSSEALIGSVVPARLDGASGSATDKALPDSAPSSWQQLVQDARLRDVITLALANNRDLRLAALNIDAARAQYRISEAASLPTVAASVGGSASRSSSAAGGTGEVSRQLNVSLGITSWELDLWGRLGQLESAALNSYLATESARDGVLSTLIAEVAQAWLTVQANQTSGPAGAANGGQPRTQPRCDPAPLQCGRALGPGHRRRPGRAGNGARRPGLGPDQPDAIAAMRCVCWSVPTCPAPCCPRLTPQPTRWPWRRCRVACHPRSCCSAPT